MAIDFKHSLNVMIWHEIDCLSFANEDFVEVNERFNVVFNNFVVRVK